MFKRLLQLNGFAILAVVVFHAAGWGFVAMFAWVERYASFVAADYVATESLSYFVLRVMEQAAVFAIPAFLFVSGLFMAFAAGRQGKTVSWQVVQARIRTLIIPYLLWSVLLLALTTLTTGAFSPTTTLLALLTGQANPAYYYVPLIVQFYLLSPYLVPLARKNPRLLLLVTGLVQLFVQASYTPALLGVDVPLLNTITAFTPKWLFITRIFWFSTGIVAGFHLKTLEERLPRWRWPLLGATLLLLGLGVVEWLLIARSTAGVWVEHRETFVDTLYCAAAILTILAFHRHSFLLSDTVGDLGARSYGIYLVHSPAMEYGIRAIYHLAPRLLAHQIIVQPMLILLGLGVPLALMAIASRTAARRIYKYSFG